MRSVGHPGGLYGPPMYSDLVVSDHGRCPQPNTDVDPIRAIVKPLVKMCIQSGTHHIPYLTVPSSLLCSLILVSGQNSVPQPR